MKELNAISLVDILPLLNVTSTRQRYKISLMMKCSVTFIIAKMIMLDKRFKVLILKHLANHKHDSSIFSGN